MGVGADDQGGGAARGQDEANPAAEKVAALLDPVLRPGEKFEYTSGAVLQTRHGSMRGTYRMVMEDGRQFDAEIAPFPLTQPGSLN